MTPRVWMTFPLFALALTGAKCGGDDAPSDDSAVEGDADADADGDTDADSDSDTDADGDADLPDVAGRMEPDYCDERSPGNEALVGATEYYLGTLQRSGDSWSGTETLYLWATAEWEAIGGADCVVVWNLSASTTSTTACGACDYGLSIDAVLDTSATTCGSAFTEGTETSSFSYDVDELDDGTANVYFARSGNPLGSGYHSDTGLNYLSNRSCAWF